MPNYVSHLESAIDGTQFEPGIVHTMHKDRPLWVRYDLESVRQNWLKESLSERDPTIWRYRELLPVGTEGGEISLGEGMSPLINCPRLASQLGLDNLWIKDESQLPTGSFKSRGLSMAITMAKKLGISTVAIPTAGNAGGATAAYAARAGIKAFVFMPEDTPIVNQYETQIAGAHVFLVNGLINDCGRIVREGKDLMRWFDLSTLKEPYRIEGKKTMGLELAEQLNWDLPDVVLYPTGGGTGLIGMWKAFHELRDIGWLNTERFPRMVSVQSDGCCPIARAYQLGQRFAEPFLNAATLASGLRVPMAVGDFMILDAIRQSHGKALAVKEQQIPMWMRMACAAEGISLCPESAACVGAVQSLIEEGWLGRDERVVIYNTGAVQKYVEAMRCDLPRLNLDQPIDWQALSTWDSS